MSFDPSLSAKLPVDVTDQLRSCGWFPGRTVGSLRLWWWQYLLRRRGFKVNHFVTEILREFGGLSQYPLIFGPSYQLRFEDPHFDSDLKLLSEMVERVLCPFGVFSGAFFCVCERGSLFIWDGKDQGDDGILDLKYPGYAQIKNFAEIFIVVHRVSVLHDHTGWWTMPGG